MFKKFLLTSVLLLLFLSNVPISAKNSTTPDINFEERISAILREHKVMTQNLIAYMEYKRESIDLLARVAYKENWYTDKDRLTARWTMGVVMNRVASPYFPNTVKEVLYQKGQYSTTKYFFTDDPPEECYEMARDVWKNGVPDMPKNVLFQSQQPNLGRGHWKSLNGEYFAYG